MNSSESSDGTLRRSLPTSSTASSIDASATIAVTVCSNCGTRRRRAAVTTASVPSEPASTDGQWKPTVSFGRPDSEPMISPFASTASIPTTCARIVPNRSTRDPPAFVAIAPPIVATSRAAKSTGVSSADALAARFQSASVTPAPAVTWNDEESTGPISSSRPSDSTITARSSWVAWRQLSGRGTLPPTRPLFPACGTTTTCESLQYARTAPTSALDPGRTTAVERPAYRPVQSVSNPAR